jgi:hypothetical protein
MRSTAVSIAVLVLLFAGSKAQAQTIELESFAGEAFCYGTKPFWSLDYADGNGRWSNYGSDGWLEVSLAGTFRVAGAAYDPVAV